MPSGPRDFIARFLSDTSKFKTDPVEKELDQVADTGDDTADELAKDFEKAARDVDDAFDKIAASSRRSMSDVGDEVEGGGRRIKEVGSEIGAEFSENIGEGLRSGDIAGTLEETGTSLAAALGPLGIGVGIGTALVANIVRGISDQKARITEAANSIFDTLVESGAKVLTELDIQNRTREQMTGENADKLRANAEKLGIPFAELARAIAGDADAMERVRDVLSRVSTDMDETSTVGGKAASFLKDSTGPLVTAVDEVNTILDESQEAARIATQNLYNYEAANRAAASSITAVSDAYRRGDYVAALQAEGAAEKAAQRASGGTRP